MSALRIGVLGWGALGSAIGAALDRGEVAGAELVAIGARREIDAGVPVVDPSRLAASCDVIVEAATHDAVVEYVPGYLEQGCRVIVLSTGAFRDQTLFDRLVTTGSDRLIICSGAIGALDIIRACRRIGAVSRVTLETSKPPQVLIQPWMNDSMVAALNAGTERVVCFDGLAIEAAERFPTSVNVAATLAIAVGDWDTVHVSVVGDPSATGNRHRIHITADAGQYKVDVANAALASNPRSSALVVGAALRAVAALATNEAQFL